MLVQKPYEQPTTGPNTTLPSFSLRGGTNNTPAALNLVDSIVHQNKTLKTHINRIELSLDKTKGLSQGLLSQNQKLRSLYKQRTSDIMKLIKSISLESDEERTNYQHRCHLLQELNYATLKEIKNIDQEIQKAKGRSQEQQGNIDRLVGVKNQLEHDSLKRIRARLNNGISGESIAQLKRNLEEEVNNNRALEREVNDLLANTAKTAAKIRHLSCQAEPQRHSLPLEKQDYEQRVLGIADENRKLLEEHNSDRVALERAQEEYAAKQASYKKVVEGINEEQRKYKRSTETLAEMTSTRESIKVKIGQSSRRSDIKKNEFNQLKGVRADLMNKVQTFKKNKSNIQNEFMNTSDKLKQGLRQNINAMNKQLVAGEVNMLKQRNMISKQNQKFNSLIAIQEQQASSLDEQIQNYSQLIRQHPNPICQIQRIELTMRLKKKK